MTDRAEYGRHEQIQRRYLRAIKYIDNHRHISFEDFVKLSEMLETPTSPAQKWKEIQAQGGLMFQNETFVLQSEARDIMRSDLLQGAHDEKTWLRAHRDWLIKRMVIPLALLAIAPFLFLVIITMLFAYRAIGNLVARDLLWIFVAGWVAALIYILYTYLISPRIR